MSEFHVTVVRLGDVKHHPNADALDITRVFDYPVVTKRGAWSQGELAAYVPIDSIVPDTEDWHFLAPQRYAVGSVPQKYRVIEAKRLRGIFSQGLLTKLPAGEWKEGDDVASALGIEKYEPDENMWHGQVTGGEAEKPPPFLFPVYTDIEGLRRHWNVLVEGEPVIITEKIHGANARYVHDGTRLWVGSRTQVKRKNSSNLWWVAAEADDLERKCALAPGHIFYGEVFGQVQDLRYGRSSANFRCFDVFSVEDGRYLDHEDAVRVAAQAGIEWVPIINEGPWNPALATLAEGTTLVTSPDGAPVSHVREGFVVKPVLERHHDSIGRVILKRHGEGYLLRKK